ncbi:MAG: sigma-70 family RNA polymerase sigma factor [Chloroflexi bacterium]|nr:sigma-70 family RNA polymerase sigma factor [Chloroflexota bacterium]
MSQEREYDHEQFATEIINHLDRLYRTARHLVRSEADAEDLVQDTVIRALERRHLFQRGTHLKAWLLTIMTRLYINRNQQEQRRPQVSLEEIEEFDLYTKARCTGHCSLSCDPADLVGQRIAAEDIRNAIAELPEEFRSVVVLSVVNEMSYAEIAGALEIPIGTVRSRLSRGRSLLRRGLWQYLQEPA